MPEAYVPNWIRAADPVQPFLQGYQIGQQRAIAETQAMERQAAMAMRAQEQQAERELQAQRIAEQADINRRTLAANAAEVAQKQALAKQALDLKAAEAAQRMAGLRDMQADIAAGVPEGQAFSKHAWKILGSQAGQFYAAKARQDVQQQDMTPKVVDLPGVGKVIVGAKGGFEVQKPNNEQTQQQALDALRKRMELQAMIKESAKMYSELRDPNKSPAEKGEIQLNRDKLEDSIRAFTTPPATNAPVQPPAGVVPTQNAMLGLTNQFPELTAQVRPTQVEKPKQKLTREMAVDYLRKAKGDKSIARQLARDDGYEF